MNLLTKVFVPLAITCGAAWLLKQFVIVASGGGDVESPLIAALWGTGMLTFLLACALGTALLQHHRHADAIEPLTRAAANSQPLARTNLGICLLQLGRPAEALREFAEAARLLPGDQLVLENLQRAMTWARAAVAEPVGVQ